MNGKNIKKLLNAKLNRWLNSITDDSVKKLVRENTIITGGALVSMLTGEEVNDYDVYFKTKEAVKAVADYYVQWFNKDHECAAEVREDDNGRIRVFIQGKGMAGEDNGITDETEPMQASGMKEPVGQDKPKYRPVFLSSNAITLSDKVQIVIRFYGEPEEIHSNYDFIHCTCYWTSWDNHLELPARALEAILNKELFYMGSKYPLCSIIRTRKFISRGYSINAGQYLKMALQLNELDLKNIDVLEDQLAGVDSAYFMAAIDAIREKQIKEPGFGLDNSYLFTVINKIF